MPGSIFDVKDEKSKIVLSNAFYSLFIKGLNVLANFLAVPLILSFLDTTQYGIWLTLMAILGWFSLFDLGMGNGLRNHLTVSIAKQDFKEGKIYVSTTYAALSVIFGSLIILFLFTQKFINWPAVFNAPAFMTKDINYAVLFAICFLFLQFVVRLINTVLLSFQRAAMADFTNSLVQVFVLIGLYTLRVGHYHSLTAVAIVYSVIPVIVFLAVSVFLFVKTYSFVSPSITFVKSNYVKKLLKLGLNFFIIQMATLILYASDNFIIAQLFTPAEVTIYNIAFKYFSVASIFFTIVLAPFWSMTTQAQEEGDWKWIRSAVKKLTALWVFLLIGGLVQLAVATPIYKFWTTNKILVPLQLSIVMFIYFLVSNWGSIYSNFINGIGKIKIQLVTATMGMIFNIPLAIFLVKFCHIGVIGVPVATIITMGGANIASMVQYRKIVNNTARGIWNK